MKTAVAVFLGFAGFFAGAAALAEESQDPFAGKSLEEIRKLLEERAEGRKKDQDFARDFATFFKREEAKLVRAGLKLATASHVMGEVFQGDLLFRYGQHTKSIPLLMDAENKAQKNRRQNRWMLQAIYLLLASAYTYMEKPVEAAQSLREAQNAGAIGDKLDKIRARLTEYRTRRQEADAVRGRRDLAPRGGAVPGDLQWELCVVYREKIFSPVEEFLELSWLIEAFPDHPKVKSGDADWALVVCCEKLLDYRQVLSLTERFARAFPEHAAVKEGDLLWAQAKAQFGKGAFKDAKRVAETLKEKHPKFGKVASREVDALVAECDRTATLKERFAAGDPFNSWWNF